MTGINFAVGHYPGGILEAAATNGHCAAYEIIQTMAIMGSRIPSLR